MDGQKYWSWWLYFSSRRKPTTLKTLESFSQMLYFALLRQVSKREGQRQVSSDEWKFLNNNIFLKFDHSLLRMQKSQKSVKSVLPKNALQKYNQCPYKQVRATLSTFLETRLVLCTAALPSRQSHDKNFGQTPYEALIKEHCRCNQFKPICRFHLRKPQSLGGTGKKMNSKLFFVCFFLFT